MTQVLLGLGSNLGDRADNLRRAVVALRRKLQISVLSALYETAPMYVLDQPSFINMALLATTVLSPQALLAFAKEVEAELGRVPGVRFGPRCVDVDILFYGNTLLQTSELEIPHPRLTERAFVLVPLVEIAPDFRHPRLGPPMADLLAALGEDGAKPVMVQTAPDW